MINRIDDVQWFTFKKDGISYIIIFQVTTVTWWTNISKILHSHHALDDLADSSLVSFWFGSIEFTMSMLHLRAGADGEQNM